MNQKTDFPKNGESGTKRILITAGGTSEIIDSVRSITNHSTGRLGKQIAEAFLLKSEFEIDYVTTHQAVLPDEQDRLHLHYIQTTMDLKETLEYLLEKTTYHAVIHSMAVSDFTPESSISQKPFLQTLYQHLKTDSKVLSSFSNFENLFHQLSVPQTSEKKISSNTDHLLMVLKQNPKIIQRIKQMQPTTLLVGFKLLVGVKKEELLAVATESLKKNSADFVLANDLESITQSQHIGYLVSNTGVIAQGSTKPEIASMIVEAVSKGER